MTRTDALLDALLAADLVATIAASTDAVAEATAKAAVFAADEGVVVVAAQALGFEGDDDFDAVNYLLAATHEARMRAPVAGGLPTTKFIKGTCDCAPHESCEDCFAGKGA